jgi:transcriptional regulator with XRE-family HTH domain
MRKGVRANREKLRRLRESKGLTQDRLAYETDDQVSRRTVRRAESGDAVEFEKLERIAAVFDVPTTELLMEGEVKPADLAHALDDDAARALRDLGQEAALSAQEPYLKSMRHVERLLDLLHKELGVTEADEFGVPKVDGLPWSPAARMIQGLLSSWVGLLRQARETFDYCRDFREGAFRATPEGRAMAAVAETIAGELKGPALPSLARSQE